MKSVNCRWNDQGAWCRNKKVKRSMFGIGARCCIEYNGNKACKFKELFPKPKDPPSPLRIKKTLSEPKELYVLIETHLETLKQLETLIQTLKEKIQKATLSEDKTKNIRPKRSTYYMILSNPDRYDLEKAVDKCIKNGFVPFNSPFFVKNRWYQAVIHETINVSVR